MMQTIKWVGVYGVGMSAKATQPIEAKRMMDELDEGDRIMIDGRDEPLTVYRHVTENDVEAQAITMRELDEEHAKDLRWQAEHTDSLDSTGVEGGDLVTGELTGDEFLVARGPRGGAYILTQWWNKQAGRWTADIAFYRRTREGKAQWSWENTVNVAVIGHEDIDRDEFDADIESVVRHTDLDGRTAWSNLVEGEVYNEYGRDDDSEASVESVCRDLYDSDADVFYSGSAGLLIIEVSGEADEPPQEAVQVARDHGWVRDESETFDGEYDPYENTTIFAFRPSPKE